MARSGPFIHQVYIADGFADDCDELIHRCLSAEKVDYHFFCKIWKEMNMGSMYDGRTLGAEIAELSEEVIHVGKHYMLKDTSNFEESVIGVFIVYALLHLQPYKGFAHLRLVPEDLPAINRIEQVARRDKRYDVLYALGSILIKGPVQYHAAEREYGMDIAVRKYLEGFTSIDRLGVRPKGVFRRQNEELDTLKELHSMSQRYTQTKMMISEKATLDRDLQYVDPNLPKELETELMKLITGTHEDQYGVSGENSPLRGGDGNKVLKSRRAIKERAMKQDVKPARHLVQVKNKKTTSSKLEDKAGSSKSNKGGSKSKAKEKTCIAISESKRRIPVSPRSLKKERIRAKAEAEKESTSENDESDSEDVIEIIEKREDCDNSIASSSDIVNIGPKNKGKGKKTVKKEKEKDQEWKGNKNVMKSEVESKQPMNEKITLTENKEENEQELDIEIDTLPVIIRTEEQGRLFEIEIIDNFKTPVSSFMNKPPIRTYKKKNSASKKISAMPGVGIEKAAEPTAAIDLEPVPSTSSANQYATITEINEESKKSKDEVAKTGEAQGKQVLGITTSQIDKRDRKRVHIKSKLKRLGILPLANFNVDDFQKDAEEEFDESDLNDDPKANSG